MFKFIATYQACSDLFPLQTREAGLFLGLDKEWNFTMLEKKN